MLIVSGDREELRAVTIERTRTLFAEAWPAIEAGASEMQRELTFPRARRAGIAAYGLNKR
jgi:hypothetical protein